MSKIFYSIYCFMGLGFLSVFIVGCGKSEDFSKYSGTWSCGNRVFAQIENVDNKFDITLEHKGDIARGMFSVLSNSKQGLILKENGNDDEQEIILNTKDNKLIIAINRDDGKKNVFMCMRIK